MEDTIILTCAHTGLTLRASHGKVNLPRHAGCVPEVAVLSIGWMDFEQDSLLCRKEYVHQTCAMHTDDDVRCSGASQLLFEAQGGGVNYF